MHSEAPTKGSIILASLLLKIGVLGIARYILTNYPIIYELKGIIDIICILSIIYASLSTINQIDIKKLIALFFYST